MRTILLSVAMAMLLLSQVSGISYDIIHADTVVQYDNNASHTFTTNTPMTNLTVTEQSLSHFELRTNGGTIYAGSNFMLNVRAVDALGYHVTVTNATNINLAALTTNFFPTGVNFSLASITFVSESATEPDFDGTNIFISYPTHGEIYVKVEQPTNNPYGILTVEPTMMTGQIVFDQPRYLGYGASMVITLTDTDRNADFDAIESVDVVIASSADTTGETITLYETGISTGVFTNDLGFATAIGAGGLYATNNAALYARYTDTQPAGATNEDASVFKLAQEIIVEGPFFVLPDGTTNIRVLGIDDEGVTNDITGEFVFTSANTNAATIVATNRTEAEAAGLGNVVVSNIYQSTLVTNAYVLVPVRPTDAKTFAIADLDVSVPIGGVSEPLYIDVRKPDAYGETYAVSNYTAAIAEASLSLQAGTRLVDDSLNQISAVRDDFTYYTGVLAGDMALTFTYDELLVPIGGVIQSESGLVLVMLSNANGHYVWHEVAGAAVDSTNNVVTANVREAGVYALMSRETKIVEDLTRAAAYPNPFNLKEREEMYFVNLPQDTTYIRIFSADGRLIRTLRIGEDIRPIDVDGMSFYGGVWDGKDDRGRTVRYGLYFAEIRTEEGSVHRKFVVEK